MPEVKPMDVSKTASMQDGTQTKPLYIKHLSAGDWAAIERVQAALGGKTTVADAVRFCLRKTGGTN